MVNTGSKELHYLHVHNLGNWSILLSESIQMGNEAIELSHGQIPTEEACICQKSLLKLFMLLGQKHWNEWEKAFVLHL